MTQTIHCYACDLETVVNENDSFQHWAWMYLEEFPIYFCPQCWPQVDIVCDLAGKPAEIKINDRVLYNFAIKEDEHLLYCPFCGTGVGYISEFPEPDKWDYDEVIQQYYVTVKYQCPGCNRNWWIQLGEPDDFSASTTTEILAIDLTL